MTRREELAATLHRLAATQRNMPVPLTDQEHTDLREAAYLLDRMNAEPSSLVRLADALLPQIEADREIAMLVRALRDKLNFNEAVRPWPAIGQVWGGRQSDRQVSIVTVGDRIGYRDVSTNRLAYMRRGTFLLEFRLVMEARC